MRIISADMEQQRVYDSPEIRDKHKIYAAVACGAAEFELKENNELFSDHTTVLIDKYLEKWMLKIRKNIEEILPPESKCGFVSGDDADFLVERDNLREIVINAAKEADNSLAKVNNEDFHIVWRLDQTLFNFEEKEQKTILGNIMAGIKQSGDMDEFYLGVARTPETQNIEQEATMDVGLFNETSYLMPQNAAYMTYLSGVMLGIPLRNSKYFSKFIAQDNLTQNMIDANDFSQREIEYMFDLGVELPGRMSLPKYGIELKEGIELSFIKSRRPTSNIVEKYKKMLGYNHITSYDHPESPESIIAFGKIACAAKKM